jgi:hypothetical protein
MRTALLVVTAMALPLYVFGVDGTVLINQSTVMATGGFPYKITLPGSYRLSGNLTVPDANTTAIEVNTNNVTIDLNGFSILGPVVCSGFPVTSCSPTGFGVGIHNAASFAVEIANGVIRGMGSFGISMGEATHIKGIRAISNGVGGITNNNGTVESSVANSNGGVGIVAFAAIANEANFNAGDGIQTFGIAVNNVVFRNGANGIETGVTATVNANFARENRGAGINAGCPSSVVSNTLDGNAGGNVFTRGSGCVLATNAPAP